MYDNETLQLDREFFNKIRNNILPQDVIFQVKESGFSENPFHSNLLFKIFDILSEEKRSDFHFFNPKLNNAKDDLIHEIGLFREITGRYIFGAFGENMLGIPKEWIYDQPDRYEEASKNIYDQEKKLLTLYDKFIQLGKRTLKV